MPFDDIIIEIINKFMLGEKVDVEHYLNQYPEYREMILDKLRTLDFIKKGFEEQSLKDQELGEYVILQELGHGGMGTVFLAIQPSLSRLIALKVFPPDLAYYKEALKNFHEEAKIIAKFNHPNIIPVYSVGKDKGINYIAMAYIAGLSLNNFIDRIKEFKNLENLKTSDIKNAIKPALIDKEATAEKIITLKRNPIFLKQTYYQLIASLFAEISEAVSYAHQNGIIHGDLKPSNILLTYELIPTVADFGLSKDIKKLASSKSREFTGTLVYAAPEQINNNIINEKTDIWSLGVSLYELLTLKNPFLDNNIEKMAYNILKRDPLPLKSIDRKIPIELEAITLKCLEKNPEKRYNSALELSQDLQNYLELKPIKAKPINFIGRTKKCIKRKPVLSGVIILFLLSAMLFSLILYTRTLDSLALDGLRDQNLLRWGSAKKNYDKVLKLSIPAPFTKEARVTALIGLSGIHSSTDNKQSFACLTKALQLDPKNPKVQWRMAYHYENLGMQEEALKWYLSMLKDNPNWIDGICLYSSFLNKLGQHNEALEFLADKNRVNKFKNNPLLFSSVIEIMRSLVGQSQFTDSPINTYDKVKEIIISAGFDEESAQSIIEEYNKKLEKEETMQKAYNEPDVKKCKKMWDKIWQDTEKKIQNN